MYKAVLTLLFGLMLLASGSANAGVDTHTLSATATATPRQPGQLLHPRRPTSSTVPGCSARTRDAAVGDAGPLAALVV